MEHGEGTVYGTSVLARGRVHVSCLHYVNWGGHHGGTEASPKCRGEVAGEVIYQETNRREKEVSRSART